MLYHCWLISMFNTPNELVGYCISSATTGYIGVVIVSFHLPYYVIHAIERAKSKSNMDGHREYYFNADTSRLPGKSV